MISSIVIISVFIGLFSGIITGVVFFILSGKKNWSLAEKVAYLYFLIAIIGVILWSACYALIKLGQWAGLVA